MTTSSRVLSGWACETRFEGEIGDADVRTAVSQFHSCGLRDSKGRLVWLIDAENAALSDTSLFDSIKANVGQLRALGLGRIAIVLPPLARLFEDPIRQAVSTLPVQVFLFDTRDEAIQWIWGGCP